MANINQNKDIDENKAEGVRSSEGHQILDVDATIQLSTIHNSIQEDIEKMDSNLDNIRNLQKGKLKCRASHI